MRAKYSLEYFLAFYLKYSYYIFWFSGIISINLWYYFIGYDEDNLNPSIPNNYLILHILLYSNLLIRYLLSFSVLLKNNKTLRLIIRLLLVSLFMSYLYGIDLITVLFMRKYKILFVILAVIFSLISIIKKKL